MDLMTGLAAVSQALGIAKDLRDIDRSINESEFKLKLAELQITLADAKIALSDARVLLGEKDTKIGRLESELEAARSGEICPLCRRGRLEVQEIRPRPTFKRFGVQEHDLVCSNPDCHHQEARMHDPNGRVARPQK